MTDGSLKLMETARISRSYTEITSTLPWHQSVTAFCQWTIFRGSYDAFRRSVCSIDVYVMLRRALMKICLTTVEVSSHRDRKPLVLLCFSGICRTTVGSPIDQPSMGFSPPSRIMQRVVLAIALSG